MNRLMFVILLLVVLFCSGVSYAQTCADLDGASVFSTENRPLYLGFIGSEFSGDSINNLFGTYGSEFASDSVRNTFGKYGGEFSSTGANNDFATSPPKIVKNGIFIAYLSTNDFLDWPNSSLAVLDASCTFAATQPSPQFSKTSLDDSSTGWGGVDVSLGGSWYNPDRSGEGFVFDFFTSGQRTGFVVYFYTYDLNDHPIFLLGAADVVPNSLDPIVVDVFWTRGTSFGSGFNKNDVVEELWGTLTIEFFDCGNAQVSWSSIIDGFGSGSTDITRLVPLGTGITCP